MTKSSRTQTFLMAGGVGNQLFIFAAGSYYSHQNNVNVIFDFGIHADGMTNHSSDIRALNPNVIFQNQRFLLLAKAVMNRLSNNALFATYSSPHVGYDPALENPLLENQIFGYFQTYKYLKNPAVRQMVDSLYLGSTSEDFCKQAGEMRCIPTISVHLRRGDYVKLRDSFGILSAEYYKSAIEFLLKGSPSKFERVLIFSDESEIAKQLF
jgi:hypothetical protein